MPSDPDDGFQFHRNVLTMMLDELEDWDTRVAKANLIIERMSKAGLLAPKPRRGPGDSQ